VIQHSVVLAARPESLFRMYLDATCHAAITGFPVEISGTAGADFRAFNGQLSGMILAIVEPHLIVQSWRSTKFGKDDDDSTLILMFSPGPAPETGRIDLTHLDVPGHDYQDVVDGWHKFYWTPWDSYVKQS
jgi:uncharacterized protein YndB with AHSA1/START domain